MRVLIVEDDYLQAGWLKLSLEERFPGVSVEHIRTETDFREELPRIVAAPPDLVLMDVMIRWTDPAPDMKPAPPEIREAGYYRAGLRCEHLLRQHASTREIPVILYTVLEEKDLSAELEVISGNTAYVGKDSDPTALFEAVVQAVHGR